MSRRLPAYVGRVLRFVTQKIGIPVATGTS
jgi:hypothetical protein